MTHDDFISLYLSVVRKFAHSHSETDSHSETELTKSAERVWKRHEDHWHEWNKGQARRVLEAAGLVRKAKLATK